ncbi:LysR family transcriptional regulator [Acidovorax sp. sif1233]|uniref:LysR substrate-binding domain-containing protein n=1 Tax=unclassified Acidovorax TaxID=2684926 RepID=UPI001C44F568|nr:MULTISPECIES: LysR substrate-binding domain-containing protein [unclassified Acidovorax]MBV7427175.1 LysR family transcriptional regulator [Acidovorax sp. sif0732]MBV7448299.1 LysR family transcriptional regulator [Acidovorax sp. sif0715]MBV7454176.1 LysR family transcriptional regulator [Acidovorax sp. sif1233]
MRLTQLRSFHAVATEGSFTRAAQALHVSQPTVTTQVQQLEELYKVELFHRTGRRIRPTEIGERLLQLSRQMFDLEQEAVQILRDAGELRSGHLRVAAVGPSHVTKMLAAFNQRYPEIQISVGTGNSEDVLSRLLDYRADVGVLAQVLKDKRFVSVPYSEHPIVIFCNADHRFARRRSIRTAELQGEKLILREQGSTTRKAIELALKAADVQPTVVMEVASREIIREAVLQGLGVAAVSEVEYVPGSGLHAVRISDAQIRTYAHVVCLAERRDTRLIRAFFNIIGRDS